MELTAEQGRVLGCLVEKQLTTPQAYPLTDAALIAACNQSTNRDPVVQYDLTAVRLAVRGLREKDLLRTVHRSGERSEKHQHRVDDVLQLEPAQVALLAVLLLRGPQTPGELRARTERMHPFATVDDVARVLDALAARDEPLVTALPRQAGRKELRYAELLVAAGAAPPPPPPDDEPGLTLARLAEELAALRAEVAELREGLQLPPG